MSKSTRNIIIGLLIILALIVLSVVLMGGDLETAIYPIVFFIAIAIGVSVGLVLLDAKEKAGKRTHRPGEIQFYIGIPTLVIMWIAFMIMFGGK